MTDPEDVAPEFAFEGDTEVSGDPDVLLEEATKRLEYLEVVWPSIDETDPHQQVVALEIVTLRRAIESIEAGDQ